MQAFLDKYINEGRELAMSIRKFIGRIKTAPAELSDNGLFKRVNEAVEKMLNVKISPIGSTQRQQTQEEESDSQVQFWKQAEKCIQEIEITIKEKAKKESPTHSFGVQERDIFDIPSFDLGISPIRSPTAAWGNQGSEYSMVRQKVLHKNKLFVIKILITSNSQENVQQSNEDMGQKDQGVQDEQAKVTNTKSSQKNIFITVSASHEIHKCNNSNRKVQENK